MRRARPGSCLDTPRSSSSWATAASIGLGAWGALSRVGFDGPISVHTEYDFDETVIRQVGYADSTPPNLEEWAMEDAAFLRRALDGAATSDSVV